MSQALIETLSFLALLLTLWFGFNQIQPSKPLASVILIAEVILMAVALFNQGWRGGVVFLGANTILLIVFSIRLALQYDEVITRASAQGKSSKEELLEVRKKLHKEYRVFASIRPLETANLILLLSQRSRDAQEILDIGPYIAMLQRVNDMEAEVLVKKFDRLLRCWNKSSKDSSEVADRLTMSIKKSPNTLEEMLDMLIDIKCL